MSMQAYITDKERHEVAEKLRERTKKPMGKSMQRMFTETLGMYVHNICWMNPHKATARWDIIVKYLADLIDRPTCHLVEDEDGRTACSECGCSALYMLDATYCPDCGCVIAHD